MNEAGTLTCRQLVELVTEYLEGGLEARERRRFEQHVVVCPPCRGYLSQLRTVARSAPGLSEDALPEELRDRLVDAFRAWREAR